MTTIQIDLPDQLAQDAEQAGLLSPGSLEKLLRDQLKAKRFDELVVAMNRMSAENDPDYMSPEEIGEEVRAVRAERRASNAAR